MHYKHCYSGPELAGAVSNSVAYVQKFIHAYSKKLFKFLRLFVLNNKLCCAYKIKEFFKVLQINQGNFTCEVIRRKIYFIYCELQAPVV